jgi:hypothetical protein
MTQCSAWLARLTLLAGLLGAGMAYAGEQPPPPPNAPQGPGCMPPKPLDPLQRMVQLGAQLKLQPKQQSAWNGFVQASQKIHALHPGMWSPEHADAANVVDRVKQHAAQAAEQASAAQQLSKAVQQLWSVLDPAQRSLFDRFMSMPKPMHRHLPPPPPLRGDGTPPAADQPPAPPAQH